MSDDLPDGFAVIHDPGDSDLPPGFVTGAPASHKFGLGDTWPAQLVKSAISAATLPGDVYSGATPVDVSNPNFLDRVTSLAAMGSPMAPEAAASIAAPTAAKVALPTADELKSAASAGYDAARSAGVEFDPAAIANQAHALGQKLENDGINATLAPKTHSIIEDLKSPPDDSVSTISNLETARRSFGHAAKDFSNPTEQLAAKRAIDHLDDYLSNIPEGDVLSGDAAAASKMLSDARGNYAAAKRSEQINGETEIADRNAAVANSGQNIGNAMRQRFNSVLKSDRKSSGFNDAELAQMEKVARGTPVGNAARIGGNLLGGGGGLGGIASAAIGAGALGPVGAVAPVVGYALKKMSNASVARQIRVLDEMTRSRAPLAQRAAAAEQSGNLKRELAARAALSIPPIFSRRKPNQ